MKKSYLTYLFTSLYLFSFSQNGYTIKGKIRGLHDTVCYMGNHYGNKQYVKDTTRVDKDGNFTFTGKEKLPGGIYLIVPPNKKYFELLIDKEQNFSFETDTSPNNIANMKIKGSEENIQYYKFQKFIGDAYKKNEQIRKQIERLNKDSSTSSSKKDSLQLLQNKILEIEKSLDDYRYKFIKDNPTSFLTSIFKAQKEPEIPEQPKDSKDSTFAYRYFKGHYWDNVDVSDDRLLRTPIFHMKLKTFFEKVVIQAPDSIIKESETLIAKTKGNKETFKYIVWYLTSTYENPTIMGMDAIFVHLVDQYYVTNKAYWVDSTTNQKIIHKALTLKPLLMGKPAPPIILQDTADKNIALYDLKSKYTVVAFWDPDCGHCQKVIPKLKEAYDKALKAKGVTVYSIDIEDMEEKWKKFIKEKDLNFLNVHDKYKQYFFRELYDVYSTPVIYLLDEHKRIKAKRIDVDEIAGYIDYLEKMDALEKKKKQTN